MKDIIMNDIEKKERITGWVVVLTAITMVIEITFGLLTGSMALLADGIHMGSHVLAIGLSWVAYIYIKKNSGSNREVSSDRVLSLAGYTSGLLLLFFALFILEEATRRIISPVDIEFRDAILVAIIGLVVNIVSALMLHNHGKEGGLDSTGTKDQNIRAAYLHVLADAITSLSAIIGLTVAMVWGISYIDSVAAAISSIVIIKWAISLLRESGRTLLR
ncbi:MAG: cation diffusion facilitator family transporter [Bacteroidales bacterium]